MKSILVALGAGASLLASSAAMAQTGAQTGISAEEAAALQQQIEALKAQVGALEKRLDAAAPAATATAAKPQETPRFTWKGAPQVEEGDRAFKIRGRIQADAGYVSAPSGSTDRAYGFSNEIRRIRLGGEGKLGSGFGYKLELELSDNAVELVDTYISYEKGGWLLALGNQNQFQSLDELTGDSIGTFMERAAFTDAFNFERRLGLSAQYRAGPLLFQGGVFTDDVGALSNDSDGPDGGDENNSIGFDGRIVAAPKIGDTQLHFGVSAHLRNLNRLEDSGTRYRQRPFLHSPNTRPIGTPALAVKQESHYGGELAAVHGPLWVAGEAHWLRAARVDAPSATFFGGYAEAGIFLTRGDKRAYKNGIFDRTKPANPLGKGGIGAVQLALRYDYLDLNDRDVRGGRQNGYLAGLVWTPIEYLRLNLNYAHLDYRGATPTPAGDANYGVDVVGTRIELDF